jgi:hypothetical protein
MGLHQEYREDFRNMLKFLQIARNFRPEQSV